MRIISAMLLLASMSTGGCLEDAALLDEEDGELVGGQAASARFEVGQFGDGVGGSCTATLIGRQAVLTAAHCLFPMYTGTIPASGAAFVFELTALQRTYRVDRIHTFASQRFEYQPDARFTTDVAVLHLATPVPITQAVPATIAGQEPTNGQQAVMFGYGCTDRTPQSGGGFKQAYAFIVGTETRALCPGDSGGPVFDGPITGNGAQWGVTSDFSPYVESPDEMTDVFAGVPVYKKQIEAVLRGWDGVNEVEVNRPGLDYTSVTSKTAASCRTTCDNDGRCRAFTFVLDGSTGSLGRCWLKEGVPEPVPGSRMTSGIALTMNANRNRGGSDFAMVPALRADVCAAACGRDLACQAWTHVPPGGSAAGQCWLKGAVPGATVGNGLTSGVLVRELEPGVNRPGNDIATHTASGGRACARRCAEDERCEAFTVTSAAANNCFLKDAVPAATSGPGMASGVRRGVETNVDRTGGNYRTFTTGRLSPTTCQASCAREGQCQAWTYAPPVAPETAATCFLKDQVPPAVASRGQVSGLKGLEMLP